MPIHPFIVHFGIAFSWLAGLLYAVAFFPRSPFSDKQAFYIHLAAVAGICLAILSGLSAENSVTLSPEASELLKWHQIWGYVSLWLTGMLGIWAYLRLRKWEKTERIVFILVFLSSCILMSLGTHLGGKMVYEEGVGVQTHQLNHED